MGRSILFTTITGHGTTVAWELVLQGESLFTFLATLPYAFHSGRAIKISDAPEYWKSRTISVYLYNGFWEILSLKWQRMCINSSTRAFQQFRNYRFLLFPLILQRADNLQKWLKSSNSFTFVNWLTRTQNHAHAQFRNSPHEKFPYTAIPQTCSVVALKV